MSIEQNSNILWTGIKVANSLLRDKDHLISEQDSHWHTAGFRNRIIYRYEKSVIKERRLCKQEKKAHLLDGLLDAVGVGGGDVRVQRLVLAWQRLAVLAAHLAFLHRPLAADDNLSARLLLHRCTDKPSVVK